MPLTIDLPGSRDAPRSYFIADGREDPYGRIRYETPGSAKHMKALHLDPFWAAAQQRRDALALVVYHNKELDAKLNFNVQSHLVLHGDLDGFWLRGRKIEIARGSKGKPARIGVEEGDPWYCGRGRPRWESACCGRGGRTAGRPRSRLVSDGNKFGVVRLTVEHRAGASHGRSGRGLLDSHRQRLGRRRSVSRRGGRASKRPGPPASKSRRSESSWLCRAKTARWR